MDVMGGQGGRVEAALEIEATVEVMGGGQGVRVEASPEGKATAQVKG